VGNSLGYSGQVLALGIEPLISWSKVHNLTNWPKCHRITLLSSSKISWLLRNWFGHAFLNLKERGNMGGAFNNNLLGPQWLSGVFITKESKRRFSRAWQPSQWPQQQLGPQAGAWNPASDKDSNESQAHVFQQSSIYGTLYGHGTKNSNNPYLKKAEPCIP